VSVVRVGATRKYSDNWDSIFSRGHKKMAKPAASAKKAGGKKSTAKGKKKG
jgi:hypothetical protein